MDIVFVLFWVTPVSQRIINKFGSVEALLKCSIDPADMSAMRVAVESEHRTSQ